MTKKELPKKQLSKKQPNKNTPLRRCVGCMEMKEKGDLVRVILVCAEKGEYAIDQTGKANGRGAYVCENAECLLKAQKTRGLERSFKHKIPEEIYRQLSNLLQE